MNWPKKKVNYRNSFAGKKGNKSLQYFSLGIPGSDPHPTWSSAYVLQDIRASAVNSARPDLNGPNPGAAGSRHR